MITVCIPVYNINIGALHNALLPQVADTGGEIIYIDDASATEIKLENRAVATTARYMELEKNIGRAKIRNLFLQYAAHPYLLFLDCDSEIISKNFIRKYVDFIKHNNPDIISGSSIYTDKKPPANMRLRWKYGHVKEKKGVAIRQTEPHKHFMTNNFVIKKTVFEKVRFNENITGYGHEDTLFGYALAKAGFTITHFYNPVLNAHLDTNEVFLNKTKESIHTLLALLPLINFDNHFINQNNLLGYYRKHKMVAASAARILPLTHQLLRKGLPSLHLLDIYKLGLLHKAITESNISL